MTASLHPLDQPVWQALTTRQADLAMGGPRARRLRPEYGLFGAAIDGSADSRAALAELVRSAGQVWLVESGAVPVPPPGVRIARDAPCLQMVAHRLLPGGLPVSAVRLTDDDSPDMLALATLTEPGPFFARTHCLGEFVGIRSAGRLVAMAGERLRPPGHTEVSGVCTHPDHRGLGYAGGLMRLVAAGILARGEAPVLHVYASNTRAIALYETLGFTVRRPCRMIVLEAVGQA